VSGNYLGRLIFRTDFNKVIYVNTVVVARTFSTAPVIGFNIFVDIADWFVITVVFVTEMRD
jgi:hypothetical protein